GKGFVADLAYVHGCAEARKRMNVHGVGGGGGADAGRRFAFVHHRLMRDGNLRVGDRIVEPEQAATLRLIAEKGAATFYEGEIAEEIVRSVREDGGALSADDLKTYRVATTQPLQFTAFGRTFYTMPPPSSGGIALAQ